MTRRRLQSDQGYAGRREDTAVINCSVHRETAELLRQYGSGKKLGAFISRLVHEYHGRQKERQRIQARMHEMLMVEETET